jgi:hypothetical protein
MSLFRGQGFDNEAISVFTLNLIHPTTNNSTMGVPLRVRLSAASPRFATLHCELYAAILNAKLVLS